MKPALVVALAAASLLAAACAPSTPTARIEANRPMYEKLSDAHQALVRQGQIDRGMSPDAVYLAWGRPSREYEGAEGRADTLRWDYDGSRPVYSTGFFGSYGYGYGGGYGYYGRRPYYGYALSPQVDYVPYRRATVWFRDRRVTKWERARAR